MDLKCVHTKNFPILLEFILFSDFPLTYVISAKKITAKLFF